MLGAKLNTKKTSTSSQDGACASKGENNEKDGGTSNCPLLSMGISDTKINYEQDSEDDLGDDEELVITKIRCLSQSTNVLLGKSKKGKGRRRNKQKRKDKAKEKGIISVFDFLKRSKGGKSSLGDQ